MFEASEVLQQAEGTKKLNQCCLIDSTAAYLKLSQALKKLFNSTEP